MPYFVTFGDAPIGIGAPLSLEEALAEACYHISKHELDVAIQDGSGKSIRGEDLAACCRGEKTLTTDLLRNSN